MATAPRNGVAVFTGRGDTSTPATVVILAVVEMVVKVSRQKSVNAVRAEWGQV
jgi:hypothetical protein